MQMHTWPYAQMKAATLITSVMFLFAVSCSEDARDLVGVPVSKAATLATAAVWGWRCAWLPTALHRRHHSPGPVAGGKWL